MVGKTIPPHLVISPLEKPVKLDGKRVARQAEEQGTAQDPIVIDDEKINLVDSEDEDTVWIADSSHSEDADWSQEEEWIDSDDVDE